MLQVYFKKEKINYNLKIIRLYQPINSNINHSNVGGVNQKFEIIFPISNSTMNWSNTGINYKYWLYI